MRNRTIAILAALALLVVPATVAAADDLRETYDNKTEAIDNYIADEKWDKADTKAIDWVAQLGAWDGAYPTDADDANRTPEYADPYTVSGAAAFGGHAMGANKGKPGLIGNIMYIAGQTEGQTVRDAVDKCIADAAVVETEPEGGKPAVSPAPEA